LTNYTGCEEHIRKAITNPGPETEDEAWLSVLPAVEQLKEFYDFSIELEQCFPKLLTALCQDDPKTNLEKRQALAKQFANAFDFVLRFDDLKMLNPAIQNDFSYYRRTLNRMKLSKKHHGEITIKDELANRMSLFFCLPNTNDECDQRDHFQLPFTEPICASRQLDHRSCVDGFCL